MSTISYFPCNRADYVLQLRTQNSNVWMDLSLSDKDTQCLSTISDSLAELIDYFIWFTRCCANATEIADTFNCMHLSGIFDLRLHHSSFL